MPPETGSKSRLRDELIKRAKLGEISPEDAEDEAHQADCEPLEVLPESLDLDPRTEEDWTLLMVLVWIIERDPNAVRAVWTKARRDATQWVSTPLAASDGTDAANKTSWELKALDRLRGWDVEAVVEESAPFMLPPIIISGPTAYSDLLAKLQSGHLSAQGKHCETGERQAIPTSDWMNLDWLRDPTASAEMVGSRMEDAPKYDEVTISWQKVREIWPPLEELPSEEYHRHDWTVDCAILWVAHRNPALFHFVGLRGPRARAQFSTPGRRDPAPRKSLLEAMKTGALRAIHNGQEIPPLYWFGKELPKRMLEGTPVFFRRSDVMRIFEEEPPVASNSKKESAAKKALAGHLKNTPDLTRADAQSFLQQSGLTMTGRPFHRVWSKARVEAGLPEKASAGRRRKSSS
jgi:hypothetical protein